MENDLITPWYSLSWFDPTILRSYSWEQPLFLWLILIIPLLFVFRWLIRYYFSQKLPVAVSSRDLKSSPTNLIRLIP